MEPIRMIIVEDDKATCKMYEECIETYNSDKEDVDARIEADFLENDEKIPNIIYSKRIDAIIIDLDWGSGYKKNEGNKLVEKFYKDCRIPIFIVSGNLHLLEAKYDESPIFKKYQRDQFVMKDFLSDLVSLYKTGYTKALGNYSEIDDMLSKVFWEHMSEVIKVLKDEDRSLKNKRMLRFAITRINEMLSINGEDSHDEYDALEFYIKPSIKKDAFTGDIVKYNDKEYIVITAACDMVREEGDYVVLCQIDYNKFEELKNKIKRKTIENAILELDRYTNNAKNRYHLLPPCKIFKGGLIDFQMVNSVDKNEFQKTKEIIASINPAFSKDIQARFSHYYGRQGQPQLNSKEIANWIRGDGIQ